MMQKMRRYIKAFSKDDEKEKEGLDKSDSMKGSKAGSPRLRPKNREERRGRPLSGWQIIRHSALGLDMDQYELDEDQDIKFV